MSADSSPPPSFICDAMLGGLARWLRAAGYDAYWQYGQHDRQLIELAQCHHAILLTSDSGIMQRNIIRDGTVRALFIPQQLDRYQQLAFVLRRLNLPLIEPRCMSCGGCLKVIPRDLARPHVPPKAWQFHDTFFRCQRCGTVLWRGTHWKRIAERLAHIDDYFPHLTSNED
ncbi:MAG: hypothetical protein KAT11_06145 [Phycisphaerae bacterium]|nr:hypothetical protein [Phycisphaerae bacterium]